MQPGDELCCFFYTTEHLFCQVFREYVTVLQTVTNSNYNVTQEEGLGPLAMDIVSVFPA